MKSKFSLILFIFLICSGCSYDSYKKTQFYGEFDYAISFGEEAVQLYSNDKNIILKNFTHFNSLIVKKINFHYNGEKNSYNCLLEKDYLISFKPILICDVVLSKNEIDLNYQYVSFGRSYKKLKSKLFL